MRDNQQAGGAPGEVLRKLFMEPLGLTAYRVASDLQVPPIAISEILRGKRAITTTMALRLGQYFGVDPQFWLALQAAQDLRRLTEASDGSRNGRPRPAVPVSRCAALEGRTFILRETKTPTGREWQVLITRQGPGSRRTRENAPMPGAHQTAPKNRTPPIQ